jgi:ABC-2 type transport system permease protein
MAALPIAALALVPSGAVSGGLYDGIQILNGAFPFRATLDALDSALGRSGDLWVPLLHLALLAVAWVGVARLALRRFA